MEAFISLHWLQLLDFHFRFEMILKLQVLTGLIPDNS
jgi:hypothetical protein